jgi:hypothetical protein
VFLFGWLSEDMAGTELVIPDIIVCLKFKNEPIFGWANKAGHDFWWN